MDSEMQTSKDIPLLETSCQEEHVIEDPELYIRDMIMSQTKGRQKDGVKVSQPRRIKNNLELWSMNRT